MRSISAILAISIILLGACSPTRPNGIITPNILSTKTPVVIPTVANTAFPLPKPATEMWGSVHQPLIRFSDLAILPQNEMWAIGTDIVIHSHVDQMSADYLLDYSDAYVLNSDIFNTIDFLSPNDGWASGYGGKIAHWNGSKWTTVTDTGFFLSDMGFSDKNNGWAVGSVGGFPDHAVILHWNGNKWENVSFRNAIGKDNFYLWSIDVVSNSNVWAVGVDNSSNKGIVLNWDGVKWQEIPYLGDDIKSVSGIGPSDVWVWSVGQNQSDVVSHWDGNTWSQTELPASDFVTHTLLAISKDDIWAGGYDLFHWDGHKWTDALYHDKYGLISKIKSAPDGKIWAITEEGYILSLK